MMPRRGPPRRGVAGAIREPGANPVGVGHGHSRPPVAGKEAAMARIGVVELGGGGATNSGGAVVAWDGTRLVAIPPHHAGATVRTCFPIRDREAAFVLRLDWSREGEGVEVARPDQPFMPGSAADPEVLAAEFRLSREALEIALCAARKVAHSYHDRGSWSAEVLSEPAHG